jgi:hypothetical protein
MFNSCLIHRCTIINSYRLQLARESHYLDLLELRSPKKDEVKRLCFRILLTKQCLFVFRGFKFEFNHMAVDEIIQIVRTAYHTAFPGKPGESRFFCYIL